MNCSHHLPLAPEKDMLSHWQPAAGVSAWYSWARWKSIELHHPHRAVSLLSTQWPPSAAFTLKKSQQPPIPQKPRQNETLATGQQLFQAGLGALPWGRGQKQKWVPRMWSPADFRCLGDRCCHPDAFLNRTHGIKNICCCCCCFSAGRPCLAKGLKVRLWKPCVEIRWENISFLHQLLGAVESSSKWSFTD